jgi:hypothetical protein
MREQMSVVKAPAIIADEAESKLASTFKSETYNNHEGSAFHSSEQRNLLANYNVHTKTLG